MVINKAKHLQVSDTDNINPLIKASLTNDDLNEKMNEDLKSTEKKQTIQPIIPEISKQAPININNVIKAMDTEKHEDSSHNETDEIEDNNVNEMLRDFIDSD